MGPEAQEETTKTDEKENSPKMLKLKPSNSLRSQNRKLTNMSMSWSNTSVVDTDEIRNT